MYQQNLVDTPKLLSAVSWPAINNKPFYGLLCNIGLCVLSCAVVFRLLGGAQPPQLRARGAAGAAAAAAAVAAAAAAAVGPGAGARVPAAVPAAAAVAAAVAAAGAAHHHAGAAGDAAKWLCLLGWCRVCCTICGSGCSLMVGLVQALVHCPEDLSAAAAVSTE
jgi:hypothetical protein